MQEVNPSQRVRTPREVLDHYLQAVAQGLDALVSDYTEQSSILLKDRTFTALT